MSSVDLIGLSMIQIFQLSFLFVAYKLDYRPGLDLTRETTLLVHFIGNPSPQRKKSGHTKQTRGVGPMLGLCLLARPT